MIGRNGAKLITFQVTPQWASRNGPTGQPPLSLMPSESYLMIFFCLFFYGVCIAELARFGQKGLQHHDFGAPCEKLAALPATEAFQGRLNMKNCQKSVGSKHFAFRTATKKIL